MAEAAVIALGVLALVAAGVAVHRRARPEHPKRVEPHLPDYTDPIFFELDEGSWSRN